jgi:formate hydrogenlyase transcriptional activator
VEFPVGESPAGLVWQTQQPLILSDVAEERRWPRFMEQARPYGGRSSCELPLTTARRRLGTLVLVSKQPSAYDAAHMGFLQLVANQVGLAVENALAFREIEAFRDKLAEEKAYLEEEVRTEQHFGEIVGESAVLRRSSSRPRPSPLPIPPSSSAARPARARSSSPAPCTT